MSVANSTGSSHHPPSSSASSPSTHLPVHQIVPPANANSGRRLNHSSPYAPFFDDFYGSSASSASATPIGHHASWANLVDSRQNGGGTTLVAKSKPPLNAFPPPPQPWAPSPLPPDAPPPYDHLHQHHQMRHHQQKQTASRQTSNASGQSFSLASSPASTAAAAVYFHHHQHYSPSAPFPLLAAPSSSHPPPSQSAPRSGSALSSSVGQAGVGGRLSSGADSSRRELRPTAEKKKRDRMQDLRDLWARPGCRLCCLACLLLMIGLTIAAAILTAHLSLPQHLEFAWFAPDQFQRQQGGGTASAAANGQPVAGATPSRGRLDVGEQGSQVRLELTGALPFRSNFITLFDFKTDKVAILDMSLRSGQRNTICFVMDLDRQNMPDMESLLRAAKNGAERTSQLHGWEESWLWTPQPLSQSPIFQPELAECRGARWVQLVRAGADQKGQKCTECFDFCLPDWGIDQDAIRDQQYLNILRRLCFPLFVPEWRPFAQSLGWQQNQHDFEQFYRRQQQQGVQGLLQATQQNQGGGGGGQQGPTGAGQQGQGQQVGGGQNQQQAMETKWISLQPPPPPQQSSAFGGGGGIFSSPNVTTQIGGQQWPPPYPSSSASYGILPAQVPNQVLNLRPSPENQPSLPSSSTYSWPPWDQSQSAAANLAAAIGQAGTAIGQNWMSNGGTGGQWPQQQQQAQGQWEQKQEQFREKQQQMWARR